MASFSYCTDAISGTIEADSLQEALEKVDAQENITDSLSDGAWAWVESQTGERLYIGRNNM